jgi:hypothetical protein
VQEYAAIQQFPPEYVFMGGTGQKYKQIGNAVPVGLGKVIGEGLLATAGQRQPEGQVRLFEARTPYACAKVETYSPGG